MPGEEPEVGDQGMCFSVTSLFALRATSSLPASTCHLFLTRVPGVIASSSILSH